MHLLERIKGAIAHEWRRFRKARVRFTARMLLRAARVAGPRLVVFLTPGHQWRIGGVLSIASLYRESKRLRRLHHASVFLCTVPGDPDLVRYNWFKNRDYILPLEPLLRRARCRSLLLHVPEYSVDRMAQWLASRRDDLLAGVRELHVNVMIQNIDHLGGQDLSALRRFGRVTCTTAHEAYSTKETRDRVQVPLHRLSVFGDPSLYTRLPHRRKEDLLVVSPDAHSDKARILEEIRTALPSLRTQIVEDLSYEEYKALMARAKWSLTFGEGLDGYFAELIFSGGIGFAVYNDRFFTPAFQTLENVYPSWDTLRSSIASDIRRLDEPRAFEACWRRGYDILADLYQVEKYRDNLRRFYRGEYTFP